MAISFQISVPKREAVCKATGVCFISEMEYYSFVYESDEGYEREDYSVLGWEREGKLRCEELNGVHWKAQVPKKRPKPQTPEERDARAVAVFKELLEDETAEADAFVLSLYLRRKKKLALRKQLKKDGQAIHLYELAGSEEILPVPQVQLSLLQTAEIQERIAERLQPKPSEEVAVAASVSAT